MLARLPLVEHRTSPGSYLELPYEYYILRLGKK
jgi:hypothetical protein